VSQFHAAEKSDWNTHQLRKIFILIISPHLFHIIKKLVPMERLVRNIKNQKSSNYQPFDKYWIYYFFLKGEGDSGDVWEVVCKGNSWKRDETIQLRHKDTDAYLGVSGNTFGRPIHGQYEIIGMEYSDASTHWQAQEGIFIHPTEQYRRPEHNEL